MNDQTIIDLLKDDDFGLLKDDRIRYGVYYKGSYWTGYTPLQAILKLFEQFPSYRITKNLYTPQLKQAVNGIWIENKHLKNPIFYTVEELRTLKNAIKQNEGS